MAQVRIFIVDLTDAKQQDTRTIVLPYNEYLNFRTLALANSELFQYESRGGSVVVTASNKFLDKYKY